MLFDLFVVGGLFALFYVLSRLCFAWARLVFLLLFLWVFVCGLFTDLLLFVGFFVVFRGVFGDGLVWVVRFCVWVMLTFCRYYIWVLFACGCLLIAGFVVFEYCLVRTSCCMVLYEFCFGVLLL